MYTIHKHTRAYIIYIHMYLIATFKKNEYDFVTCTTPHTYIHLHRQLKRLCFCFSFLQNNFFYKIFSLEIYQFSKFITRKLRILILISLNKKIYKKRFFQIKGIYLFLSRMRKQKKFICNLPITVKFFLHFFRYLFFF